MTVGRSMVGSPARRIHRESRCRVPWEQRSAEEPVCPPLSLDSDSSMATDVSDDGCGKWGPTRTPKKRGQVTPMANPIKVMIPIFRPRRAILGGYRHLHDRACVR